MRCVTPMFRRYEYGNHSKGQIVSRQEVLGDLENNPNAIRLCLDKLNSKTRKQGKGYMYEQIACNHCWACRLNYSAEWATRLTYQCKESDHNYFVTLTYSDDYLPIAENIKLGDKIWYNEGEEVWGEGTLWEPHVQTFLDSLRHHFREKYDTRMKVFWCGEYGETTHRPHYHLILMNAPLDISQFYDTHIDERFKAHWKSREIEKYWKYGMIDVAEAEWSSCAYVARYCMKKLHEKNNEEYSMEGKLPEFVRMSKGIGEKYYQEHKQQIYENDSIVMKTVKGNVGAFKPPKAWDKKFKEEFPEDWEKIKLSRQKASERSRKAEQYYSDYTDYEKLKMNLDSVLTKGKQLPRVGEW